MRIASIQFQATMNRSLSINQGVMAKLTEQMAANKAIIVPSDDTVTSVRLSRLTREENIVTQYMANIDSVKLQMSKNETYLDSMVSDMSSGRDLLVWSLDGSNTPSDLRAMVNSLTSLRDSLYYNANTRDQEGKYLFSGSLTNTAPIDYDNTQAPGARYSFVGNTNPQQVVVGNGVTQTANVDVKGMEAILNSLDQTIAMLTSTTVDSSDPTLHAQLTDTLKQTDTALDLISGKISKLGGAQNVMATLSDNHSNVSLSNKIAITDLSQLDYGQAATELNGYDTALKATYQAYSKIYGLSLFNVL